MLMETKCHMFSVGRNSAFDQSMEKALYNIKLNTLLSLLLIHFYSRYSLRRDFILQLAQHPNFMFVGKL
jgi:hypothetical protein